MYLRTSRSRTRPDATGCINEVIEQLERLNMSYELIDGTVLELP